MKTLALSLLVLSLSAFSKNIKWSSLYQDSSYKLTEQIDVTGRDESFTISSGIKLKLIEASTLPMISVKLFKFELPSCPSNAMKTELELLELPQPGQKPVVVGYDIIENCILEIFIEQKDLFTESILK